MTLISPEALQGRLGDPNLRIADVRWWLSDRAKGRRDYADGHLPGRGLRRPRRRPRGAAGTRAGIRSPPRPPSRARMAELGFDDASTIVAYDDAGGDDRGPAVVDARRPRPSPTSTCSTAASRRGSRSAASRSADVPSPRPGSPHAARRWTRTIERDALEAQLGERRAVIDARAPERYRGEVEPVDRVAGAHPDRAVNRPERRQPWRRTAGSSPPTRCGPGSQPLGATRSIVVCPAAAA